MSQDKLFNPYFPTFVKTLESSARLVCKFKYMFFIHFFIYTYFHNI